MAPLDLIYEAELELRNIRCDVHGCPLHWHAHGLSHRGQGTSGTFHSMRPSDALAACPRWWPYRVLKLEGAYCNEA